jgi:DNA-binding CsgD family transcriptional regulator
VSGLAVISRNALHVNLPRKGKSMSEMVNLFFNKTGNFFLQSALKGLTDEFINLEQNHVICDIAVIELARYQSMRELVNDLSRIKLTTPATSVLLVTTEEQIIPNLKCGAVTISAPVPVWKKKLASLKREGSNIDSVVRECMTYINHHHLSPKQTRVIDCLGEGMNPDEIARHLFLSVKTVYTYISLASNKYGFSTSKKFHRYIINESVGSVSCTSKLTLRLPLSDHIVW